MSIDILREQIKKLNEERNNAMLEKGLAAEENKDLRENFAYDYWTEKEMALSIKIANLIRDIQKIAGRNKPKPQIKTEKQKPITKIKDLPKNRWL